MLTPCRRRTCTFAFGLSHARPSGPATSILRFSSSTFSCPYTAAAAALLWSWTPSRRPVLSPPCRWFRVGRTPILIPPGVDLSLGLPFVKPDGSKWQKVEWRTVTIAGPLGSTTYDIPPYVTVEPKPEEQTVAISISDRAVREQREMWGTIRAYLQNNVTGVSEGHTAILRLVGVGFRATVEKRPKAEAFAGQDFLILKLGFPEAIEVGVPPGLRAAAVSPTRLLVEGVDKTVVMGFAAKIRQLRKPEPYKGKGVFINDQTIKLKGKKT